jgi:hypothetical protein
MSEVKTPEEIRAEEMQKLNDDLLVRAEQLSKDNNGSKIEPLLYLDPKDPLNGVPITGFLKEPNRMTKAAIADEIMKSQWRGNLMALKACLMEKVSDPRLQSEDQSYDAVIFAAGEKAAAFVMIAISQIKKK